MQGAPAIYLGRIVQKEHFRVFIYNADGTKKLVKSWDDYEHHMSLGIWFATRKDVPEIVPLVNEEKGQGAKKPKEFKKQHSKED